MAQDTKTIRIPVELYNKLEKIGAKLNHSVNQTAVNGLQNIAEEGVKAFIPNAAKEDM